MRIPPTFPAVLLLCLCPGCGKAPDVAPRKAQGPLRPAGRPRRFVVAAFNMNWGNVDLADTVDVIRRADADVVCLQETNPRSERHLRRELGREYPHQEYRGGVAAGGFAFLSRAPLGNVRFLEPVHGYFGAFVCEVELAGGNVQIASVHLQPVIPERNEGIADLVAMFGRAEAAHAKEIEHVWRSLSRDAPTVIAGDFNSASFGSAPRFLKERGLVNSFASVTPNPDAHVTWQWSYGGVDWRFRIDYVFHAREMKTVESRLIDAASSDHKAVVSVLEWRDPAEVRQGGAR